MASTIKLKNGSGAPTSGQLVQGEPALDLTNKRLYTENASGTVIEVGTNPSSLTIGGTALTATAAELNTLDGITATTAELNYTDGVTSNIQTQLNTKAPIASPTFTGTVTAPAVNVNGTVTADGLTVDGAIVGQSATGYATATLKADTSNTGSGGTPELRFELGGTQKARLRVDTSDNVEIATGTGSGSTRFGVASNGDISFYEDTGTTAKFFWDASAESLGIGTTSPSALLHIASTGASNIKLEDTDNGFAATELNIENGGRDFKITTPQDTIFVQGSTEAMRIDSSGNLLVGKTTTSNATAGAELNASGQIVGTFASGTHILGRNTTDGSILEFQKDGTTVGSIGVVGAAGDFYISSNSFGARFLDNSTAFIPSNTDGTTGFTTADIGSDSYKWRNLYLSGGVYLGGTGAANHLDDYEEGTWTPVYQSTTSPSGVTYDSGATYGSYTKVGNLVTVVGRIRTDGITSVGSGDLRIGGLPFTVSSSVYATANLAISNAFASNTPITGYGNVGSTYIVLMYRSSITGQDLTSQCSDLGVGNNDNSVAFSMSYIV